MKRITIHQWFAMGSLLILGPLLRLLPRLAAQEAGRAAWLAGLTALPPLLGYTAFLSRLWMRRREGTGLAELTLELLGEKGGRTVLALYALWLSFYGGFILRSGATRLVVGIYPQASAQPFIWSMGLLCLLAALGSARTLGRFAKVLLPLVGGILLLTLLLAFRGVERGNLLPVTIRDLPGLLRAAVPVLDVLGLGLFLPQFYLGLVDGRGELLPRYLRWLGIQLGLMTLLIYTVLGNFGAELVTQLTHPFFTLVRNLVLFRSLERVEALVINCWVFPDFLLVSLCVYAAQYCLRLALGEQPRADRGSRLEPGGKRWLIFLCGAACLLFGATLGSDLVRLRALSDRVVPALNLTFSYLTLPLLLAVGKIRERTGNRR